MKTKTEQVYLSFPQVQAIEKAIAEMEKDGIRCDSIIVHNNGEHHGSWIDVEPTETRYLIHLGMKAGKYLFS